MTYADRYEAAGLTKNPFAAPQEYGTSIAPIDHLFVSRNTPEPPPPGSRTLVQVIGEKGSGKSTHLEWWRSKTPGPLHYIPKAPYKKRWAQPPLVKAGFSEAIVYGDEIDRMPRPLRTRWFRHLSQREATVVIGSHEDLSAVGTRSGFDVITHHLEPLDRETLIEIIERRVAAFSVAGGPIYQFTDAEIDDAFIASAGNPREAEAICHRLVAARVGNG